MSKKLTQKHLKQNFTICNPKQHKSRPTSITKHKQLKQLFLPIHSNPIILPTINGQKYCLPLSWLIKYKIMVQKIDMQDEKQKEYTVQGEGILVYENGSPINLKQYKFFLSQYQKNLNKFFKICHKTYYLKFVIRFKNNRNYLHKYPNLQLSTNDIVNQNIIDQLQFKQIHKQIQAKVMANRDNLYKFLLQIGIISCGQKTKNKYRLILLARMAKNKLSQILANHQDAYQKPKVSSQITVDEQPQKSKNKEKCYSSITTNVSNVNKNNRECCEKQCRKNKQDYTRDNCTFKSTLMNIKNVEILKTGEELGCGGYFTVRQCQVLVKNTNYQHKQGKQVDKNEQYKMQQQNCSSSLQCKTKQFPTSQNNKPYQSLQLAIKRLKPQMSYNQQFQRKIDHQINIVKQIAKNQYVCKYYQIAGEIKNIQENNSDDQKNDYQGGIDSDVMEDIYIDAQKQQNHANLQGNKLNIQKSIIMQNLTLSLKQILSTNIYSNNFLITRQLTKAIQTLHSNGIVHRDIKPANIMFNQHGHLKLIDFSQSIECWRQFSHKNLKQNQRIGFTLPYSPIQCSKLVEQGYSNMKIDNWSLGMTVSQLLLQNLPVSYSKSLKCTIKSGWLSQQFHLCMSLRKMNHYKQLLLPIKIMCIKLMNIQSKKRICVQSLLDLLLFYEYMIFKFPFELLQ